MTNERLEEILTAHHLPTAYWPEMANLVFEGVRPSDDLTTLLNHGPRYRAALDLILAELSEQCPFKFPPPANHLESLEVA